MSVTRLSDSTRTALQRVSTATLTTCLLKRGLRNTFIRDVRPMTRTCPRMVGPAFTLRYIPAREDLDHLGVFEDPRHPQRLAIETVPAGHVLVVDARGIRDAASAGSILLTRAMIRGAAGFVSDGGLRDTPDIAELTLPVYAAGPAAPTNLTAHHAADIDVPIGCGGVPVFPGDVMVGDGEGVVVIPVEIAAEVAHEGAAMTLFEDWVETQVRGGRSIVGLYPPNADARAEFEMWRQSC